MDLIPQLIAVYYSRVMYKVFGAFRVVIFTILKVCNGFLNKNINYYISLLTDTTISRRKCTNPSDLVSQATKSPVSTVVGDHTGILGVVFLLFFESLRNFSKFKFLSSQVSTTSKATNKI